MSDKTGNIFSKTIKWLLWGLIGLVAVIVVATAGLTVWLNPARLSKLVNERASEYLDADVKVSNLRFTIWSSFPRFYLLADSVSVRSRVFDSIPESERRQLPKGSDYLGGCGNFSGAVNISSLLRGKIRLHNVEIEAFDLNMVAVNDSVANFLIFPSGDNSKVKIPEMSANSISLIRPKTIAYRSLQSGLSGEVKLTDIRLKELDDKDKNNSYDLDLAGRVHAQVDSLVILPDFPFNLAGVVNLSFKPFGIDFRDYSIGLGNIKSRASMNFEAGNSPRVNNFSFDIESFHLMRLLNYLPPALVPKIEGLDADVMVNASARLTRPYHFSSSALPSVEVSFSVPDGDVAYTDTEGDSYSARHIGLKGLFMFDGQDPALSYISIPRFRLEGEGLDLDLEMMVSDLLGSPKVHVSVEVGSRIETLRKYFAALKTYRPSGDVDIMTDIDFNLPSYSSTELEDVRLSGMLRMKDARFYIPQADATARGRNTEVRFSSVVDRLSKSTTRFPVSVEGGMGDIAMSVGKDTLQVKADNLSFSGRISGVHRVKPVDSISVALKANHLVAEKPGLRFTLRNFATTLSAAPDNHRISRPAPFVFKDSVMLSRVPHTPELLKFNVSDTLRRLMAKTKLSGTVDLRDGVLRLRDYPTAVILGACDVRWSLDSIDINRFSFSSGSSSLTMSGKVSNLRQYLNYPDRSKIIASLRANFDTLNINQLARAYETAVAAAGLRMSRADSIAAAERRRVAYARQDTTALILPRNIDLKVAATGKEVIYTNLFFKNLKTDLKMADGIFRLGDLRMRASFAGAGANLVYNTSDIEHISCDGDVRIMDLDLVKMYAKFPSIPKKVPEVVNLSGVLSLDAAFNLGIFPTMSADVPGFTARIAFKGRDLKLHQTEFIHHIARMMMIFSHDDIDIKDINISGNVHANLLELYPFDLDFSRYRLRLQGLNNFGGDLYYHIGVEHSPIPIKFGIEVEGQYHHPKLRFSGPGWNSDKARGITSRIMSTGSFNFVSEARSGMKAFVHEAAKSNVKQ